MSQEFCINEPSPDLKKRKNKPTRGALEPKITKRSQKVLMNPDSCFCIEQKGVDARSGCCSKHGGTCGCKDGSVQCCDGTASSSCTCHDNHKHSAAK